MSGAAILPLDIYRDQDFYVPAFLIKVQNREMLEEMSDVVSLTYSDSLANIDSFEMVINNWDAGADFLDQSAFKYSDSDRFNPWKDVEVWMGYFQDGEDKRRRMLIGEITTLTPNFPQSGQPTLTVRGLNLFHRFRTRQQTRAFFAKTDSQIAQELVNEIARELRRKSPQLRLRLNTEDVEETVIPYIVMDNQFPIKFLMDRARDIGYELTMDEEPRGTGREVTFNFHPTNLVNRNTYVLEWGVSLISFQPSLQVSNQVAELTVRGWNPQTKREIKVTVKRSEIRGIVTPSELQVEEPDLAKKLEIVVDRPIQNEAEARLLATNRLRQIGEVLVEARGKTVGLPDLRSGVKIEIRGVGTRFSGSYLVTSTTHTIGESGYTTDFTARMEKL